MRFYLGTSEPAWLWSQPPMRHPLFVSHRRLARQKSYRAATTAWALDSGGFTELSMFGEWRTTPETYIRAVRRYIDEIGMLDWAAPQDWMCEPEIIRKTGKSVREHQELTCRNLVRLRELDASLPIVPVLQGWEPDDYFRHLEMYHDYGIDLFDEPLVGLGTFCRRANLQPVQDLVLDLTERGLRAHGFGVKRDGLPILGHFLQSSDSTAWSLAARKANTTLCGSSHRAKRCNNCRDWASNWADRTIASIATNPVQYRLPFDLLSV